MALKKSIETSSGASASYWAIAAVYAHRFEKFIEVQFSGYLDENTRRAVKPDGSPKFRPLDNGVQRITGEAYDALVKDGPNPSYEKLYEHFMSDPAWQGAESV